MFLMQLFQTRNIVPCATNIRRSSRNDGGVDDVGGDSGVGAGGGDDDDDGQEEDTGCQGEDLFLPVVYPGKFPNRNFK